MLEDLEARILFSADGLSVGFQEAQNDTATHFDKVTVASVLKAALRDDQDYAGLRPTPSGSENFSSHPVSENIDEYNPPAPTGMSLQGNDPATTLELIVIDSTVQDLETLLDNIQVTPGVSFEFLLLDSNQNGIEQIDRYLSTLGEVSALHIVSHGEDGAVELGNARLSSELLDIHNSQLEAWRTSLAENADILFYGCDLAASDDGRLLIDSLAQILDSDVAASIDTTGHPSRGGDWLLEYQVGSVESKLFLSDVATENWNATLDITTGLIGHWTFENGLSEDQTGNSNHGVFVPASSFIAGPVGFGSAADFTQDADSDNRYLEIPDSAAYDFGQGDFTIAFWYKADSAHSGATANFIRSLGSTSLASIFATDAGGIKFTIADTANSGEVISANSFQVDSNWHPVVAVREAGTLYLHTENQSDSQSDPGVADVFVNTDAPLRLGATGSTVNELEGGIDEVRIYDRALSSGDISELMGNEPPVLNSFSGYIDTVNVNTEAEITFAEFAASANESDADGTVTGFRIDSVAFGTLRIGADGLSAMPYAAGTNDTVDATSNAYWTPDPNGEGPFYAFAAVAIDNEGSESASATSATVSVVNSIPTLTSFNAPVDTVAEDNELELTLIQLIGAGDGSDEDGSAEKYVVESVLSGSLYIGDSRLNATPYIAGSNDAIDLSNNAYWTPDANANGMISAIEVTVVDDFGAKSAPPVEVPIEVTPVSDSPVGNDRVFSVTKGEAHTFVLSNFSITDADGDSLAAVRIDSLPASGQLMLDGIAVALNEEVSAANISAGKLIYTPDPLTVGAPTDSFNFTVKDTGASSLSLTSNVITIHQRDGIVGISSGLELNTDGGNDAYLISDGALGFEADALTLEVKFAATYTENEVVFLSYAENDGEGNELLVRVAKNSNGLNVWLGNQEFITSSAIDYRAALLDGKLHSIAFTYDSITGAWASYIDGVVADQGLGQLGVISGLSSGKLVLGQEQDRVGGGFNVNEIFSGTYYDVRIWDQSLQDSEIASHHNHKFDPAALPAGLIANWQMDGFIAGQVVDVVAGNNLSIGHASAGSGFTPSEVLHDLHVDENITNGAHVGYVLPVEQALSHNIVSDPGFTEHSFARNTFNGEQTGSFGGWDVVSGNVDVDTGNNFASSPEGNDVVDLSGTVAGTIAQVINTVPGMEYELKFAFSGNGSDGAASKSLRVTADTETREMVYTIDPDYWSTTNLIWSVGGLRFVATSNTTEIRFESLEDSLNGPLLSDVEVQPLAPGIDAILQENPGVVYDPATKKFYLPVYQPGDFQVSNAAATAMQLNGVPGRLIQLETQHENNYVQGLINGTGLRFWTGGHDTDVEGHWTWGEDKQFWQGDRNGIPVNGAYTDWWRVSKGDLFDEPSNSNAGEHHLEVTAAGWNDHAGTQHQSDFIVEWEVPSVLGQYEYYLTDDADGRFAIDIDSGEITVADGDQLNFESDEFHSIEVKIARKTGSSYTEMFDVAVNNINEPPDAEDELRELNEDQIYNFSIADFPFTDIENDDLLGVFITARPGAGVLKLSGTEVTGQWPWIPVDEIDSLSYTPAADSTVSDSFGFKVVDSGGEARGGVNDDQTPNTFTFNISAQNDAPQGLDAQVGLRENDFYTFGSADFGFSDPVEGDNFQSVVVGNVTGSGSFKYNGSNVQSGDVIPVVDIDNNLLVFTPDVNDAGSSYALINFKVRDDGGTANGGSDTDQTFNLITINVANVNNAPQGTDGVVSLLEDNTKVITATAFGFTDSIDSDAMESVYIDSLPAGGTLALNGTVLTAGQQVSRADLDASLLTYTPAANAFGIGLDQIEFRVQDDGGTSNGGADTDTVANILQFNVAPVNDEPSKRNLVHYKSEDVVHHFKLSHFYFDDVEGHSLLDITIDSLPSMGALTKNGVPVSIGDVIPASEIEDMTFTPPADHHGAVYTKFMFRVRDDGGTANGGIDQDSTPGFIGFTAVSVNDAPTASNFTVTIDEDGAYTYKEADFGFTDIEDNNFESLHITSLPINGLLELNNTAVSNGQVIPAADIAQLTYTPPADAAGTAYASFEFKVQDDGGVDRSGIDTSVDSYTSSIDVLPVNDPPAATGFSVTTFEDTAYSFSLSQFSYTDIENHGVDSIIVLTLPTNGMLSLSSSPVAVGQFISATAIGNLTYTPDPNENGADLFTFIVVDDGGVLNGGSDTEVTANTVNINILSVNDAPEGTDTEITIDENASHTFTVANFGFGDEDSHLFQSVIIDSIPLNGQLLLSGASVASGDSIAVTSLSSLVYSPGLNANGAAYDTFVFKVQDDGGTNNGGIDVAAANTMTINVTAKNNEPIGQNNTVLTSEDSAYNFSLADIPFTDVENDSLRSITITRLPADGRLNLSGVPVVTGQVIDQAELSSLSYMPALNAYGAQAGSFSYQIRDDGGTANGGSDTDQVWRAMYIDVESVNDAPQGKDNILSTLEDTALQFVAADFGFSDIDGNNFESIVIDTLPTNGLLSIGGALVTAGQVVNANQIGSLVFLPEPDVYRSGYDSFSFSVRDDGGVANNGVDTDQSSNNINIDVISVNDPPVGTDSTVSTHEDTLYRFSDADFGFIDSDNNDFMSVLIESLPANGLLTLTGMPISPGAEVPYASIADLSYQPPLDQHGISYTMFQFAVRDNGGVSDGGIDTSSTSNTITIDVASVNDAPFGKDKTLDLLEDISYAFTEQDFGFGDPSDNNGFLQLQITDLPVNGALELSGVPVVAGQVINAQVLSTLRFVPEANEHRPGYDSFAFLVTDDGGTQYGGSDTDSLENRININLVAVNDAPDALDKTISIKEDTPFVFSAQDFGYNDEYDGDQFKELEVTSVPVNGQLYHLGVGVTVGQVISASSLSDLIYVPPADVHGTTVDTFEFVVRDDGGVANGGVDTDRVANTLTFNISSVNDAPIGANKTLVSDEDTAYLFKVSDFGFSDSDGNALQSIIMTTLPANGQLTLAGVPVSLGQSISPGQVPGLAFVPESNANGLSYDSFTFQVQDDGGVLNGGNDTDLARTITIDVTGLNDAPQGVDKIVSTLEDTSYTFSLSDFNITDIENHNLLNVIVTSLPINGQLSLDGLPLVAGQSISAVSLGLLVLTPEANATGVGYDSFRFLVQDDGTVANGGVDTGITENTIGIDVVSVNDAPFGSDATIVTNEDQTYGFTAAEFGFQDIDSNGLFSVTIDTLPVNGQLNLYNVPLNAGQVIPTASIVDLIYAPRPEAYGIAHDAFTFSVQDDGGTSNGGEDSDRSPKTVTIDITSVNDAPSGADNTITTLEDVAYSFRAGDFGFSDTDANALSAVTIASLPATGELLLSGVPMTVGQVVNAGQISDLQFQPVANANQSGYASFAFAVSDDGGSDNGGVDTDPSPNLITINVLSVNDAPTGTDNRIFTPEDTAYTFKTADFGFSDVDYNALQSLKIATLPVNGTLTLDGDVVVVGQMISADSIDTLLFTPQPDAHQVAYDSFTFFVQDDGGKLNGGVDTDLVARKIVVDVGSINDAPVGSDALVTILEDTDYVFSSSDFNFSDLDGNNLLAVIIDSLPDSGLLSLSGVPVVAGQNVEASRFPDLVYQPHVHANGIGYDGFDYRVVDDGVAIDDNENTALQSSNWSVNVLNVNDAPSAIDSRVTATEDSVYWFTVSDFGFSDVDNNVLSEVIIRSLPSVGQLQLNDLPVANDQVIARSALSGLSYLPPLHSNGTGLDSFRFDVRDDGGTVNAGLDTSVTSGEITIDALAVNDAPVSFDQQVTTSEDQPYTFNALDFTFSDIDGDRLQSITITSVPLQGELSLGGVLVTASQVVDAADVSKLIYTPPLNANGNDFASVTYTVQDDGGVANGGQNISNSTSVVTIDLLPVNDAPLGVDATVTAIEDTPYQFGLADFNFTDIDADSLSSIVVSRLPASGELYLAGVPVALNQSIVASEISFLEYIPQAHVNGAAYDFIDVVIVDDGGVVNGGVDTAGAASRVQIDIAAVNDSPSGVDNKLTILEDSVYQLQPQDFGFSDLVDAHIFESVRIDSLPEQGQLMLSGVLMSASQVVNVTDLVAGNLEYKPSANDSGYDYDAFSFSVIDNGGTANAGLDTDITSKKISFDVLAVNDAPSSENNTITVVEDTDFIFSPAEFVFNDPVDLNALDSIVIETLPDSGILMLAGNDLVAGQSVSVVDLLSGDLIYRPQTDQHGVASTSFTFRVQDDGSIDNNGRNISLEPYVLSIDILNVNDAPTGQSKLVAVDEGGLYVFQTDDFGFTDLADNNLFSGVFITELPAVGRLSLNGLPVAAEQFISAVDVNAGLFLFEGPADAVPGVSYGAMGFRVVDDGGKLRSGVNTDVQEKFISFDIKGVNDSPELSLTDVAFDEGSENLLDQNLIQTYDVDDDPAGLYLTLERSPANGQLLLNGDAITDGTVFTAAQLINNELYYVHDGSETDSDTFLLSLADGGEDAAPAVFGQFNITVNEVIDPLPELENDSLIIKYGQPSNEGDRSELVTGAISVIENDNLSATGDHVIALETSPLHGTVTFNEDGTFNYVHDGSLVLQDSFTYRVTNSDNQYRIATVWVNIEPAFEAALEELVLVAEATAELEKESGGEGDNTEVVQGNEAEGTAEELEFELKIDLPDTDFDTAGDSQVDSVVYFQTQVESSFVSRLPAQTIERVETRQHNVNDTLGFASDSQRSKLMVDVAVIVTDLRDITDNNYFQNALARIDQEMNQNDTQRARTYQIGSEAAFGVSISATAGVLAWALRGGALFASMMAATPLWSSIDPVKMLANKARDEEGLDSVERVFD